MSEDLPSWLRECLKEKGWSISELARQSNLPQSMISKIINGRQGASLPACQAIAKALDAPLRVVMSLAGHPLPEEQEMTPDHVEWLSIFSSLSEEDRHEMLQIGRMKAGKHGARRKTKTA